MALLRRGEALRRADDFAVDHRHMANVRRMGERGWPGRVAGLRRLRARVLRGSGAGLADGPPAVFQLDARRRSSDGARQSTLLQRHPQLFLVGRVKN